MNLNLSFPPLSGGIQQGINDPGVETFEGDHAHYVVRECVQNSLDAAVKGTVHVKISLRSMEATKLPFLPSLRESLSACQDFWREDLKAKAFFTRALEQTSGHKVYVLKISDYGTKGVSGNDTSVRSPWYGLVKSRGVSVQSNEGSAGAFGIGKDAPLAASAARTTIYSTRTVDGDVAMQGICRLATHRTDGRETQGTGFIGPAPDENHVHHALRSENEIPSDFLRSEPGLDVWVVAVKDDVNDWADHYICSALVNFWPAIHLGKLEMTIGEEKVDKNSIGRLMKKYRRKFKDDRQLEEAEQFHEAMADTKDSLHFSENLPTAGKCELYISRDKNRTARKICMTRATGMVIDTYAPRAVHYPYAGLFACTSSKGNALLKQLEPPRHDAWEAKRATDPEQARALKEARDWVREQLKQLNPDIDSEEVNVEELADILPDQEDDLPENGGDDNTESDLGGKPTGDGRALPVRDAIPAKKAKKGKKGPGKDKDKPGSGDDGETISGDEGDGKNTGGRPGTGGGKKPGGGGSKKQLQLRCRALATAVDSNEVHLLIRAPKAHNGDLVVEELTEDGKPMDLAIDSVTDKSGNALEFSGNTIKNVEVPGDDTPLEVIITPKEDVIRSIRIRTT